MNRSSLRTRIPRRMQHEYLIQRSYSRGHAGVVRVVFCALSRSSRSEFPAVSQVAQGQRNASPSNWTARARKFRVAETEVDRKARNFTNACSSRERFHVRYIISCSRVRIAENHGLTNVMLDFIRLSEYNKRRRLRIELYYFPRTEAST